MLNLNADSTSALRAYAMHLMDLGQDPSKAQEMLNKANRLEEVNFADKRKMVRSVVLLQPSKHSTGHEDSAGPQMHSIAQAGGHHTNNFMSARNTAAKRRELAAKGMSGMSAVAIADVKAARLSIMDESSAVITISGYGSTIGAIVSVSPAACRILGYTQASLLGHNINSILPEPFSS